MIEHGGETKRWKRTNVDIPDEIGPVQSACHRSMRATDEQTASVGSTTEEINWWKYARWK
jgi:hypothetical protein